MPGRTAQTAGARSRLERTPSLPFHYRPSAVPSPSSGEDFSVASSLQIVEIVVGIIDTVTGGRLTREIGRASSNWAGIGMNGGTHGSDGFWKVNKELTLHYYYAKLEDYYSQNFLGLARDGTFNTAPQCFHYRPLVTISKRGTSGGTNSISHS